MVNLIKEPSTNLSEDEVIRHILGNDKATEVDEVLQDDDTYFIYKVLKGIKEELSFIRLENEVFTYFLQKNNAISLMAVMKKDSRSTKVAFSPKNKNTSFISIRSSLGSRYSIYSQRDIVASSMSTVTFERAINCHVKNEIAEKHVQEVTKRTKKIEENGRRMLRKLRANIVATKIDITDIEESLKSFEKMVENSRNAESNVMPKNKMSTERFLNYCYNWNNNAQEFINTIRLRTGSLRIKSLQQKAANARKRDLKGLLMPVDFEKIRIVRDKYLSEIEEETLNLQGIKNLHSRVGFTLSMEKRDLIDAERTIQELQRAIDLTHNQNKKVKREKEMVEEETKNSREELYELSKQMEDFVAPSFEDYFQLKLKLAMAEKEEKHLERQNYILRMKLQNYKIKLTKQKRLVIQD